jgi:hypothetical protein
MVTLPYGGETNRVYALPRRREPAFNWRFDLVMALNAVFWIGILALIIR